MAAISLVMTLIVLTLCRFNVEGEEDEWEDEEEEGEKEEGEGREKELEKEDEKRKKQVGGTTRAAQTGCMAAVGIALTALPYGRAQALCSLSAMGEYFLKMRKANCTNCDKYFHCQGNYKAVHGCGNFPINRAVAVGISACREWGEGGTSDSSSDHVANRHGREGKDCAKIYLCNKNCKYNPADGSCKKENCP